MCKDEGDIIEGFVRHSATQVDEVIVSDNLSSDATPEILAALRADGLPLVVRVDREVAYYQAAKMTALAHLARERGHDWIICGDCDEVWMSPHGRVGDVLGGLGPEWLFATAALYNHKPSGHDDPALPPFERIGWRIIEPGVLPKVACRLSPDLEIGMGNHDARTLGVVSSAGGPEHTIPGLLVIRHFSWRSPEQFLRKIRAGAAAYAATNLPETYGAHWRMHEHASDSDIIDWFRLHFYSAVPEEDPELIFDPAPVGPWVPPPDPANAGVSDVCSTCGAAYYGNFDCETCRNWQYQEGTPLEGEIG